MGMKQITLSVYEEVLSIVRRSAAGQINQYS